MEHDTVCLINAQRMLLFDCCPPVFLILITEITIDGRCVEPRPIWRGWVLTGLISIAAEYERNAGLNSKSYSWLMLNSTSGGRLPGLLPSQRPPRCSFAPAVALLCLLTTRVCALHPAVDRAAAHSTPPGTSIPRTTASTKVHYATTHTRYTTTFMNTSC